MSKISSVRLGSAEMPMGAYAASIIGPVAATIERFITRCFSASLRVWAKYCVAG